MPVPRRILSAARLLLAWALLPGCVGLPPVAKRIACGPAELPYEILPVALPVGPAADPPDGAPPTATTALSLDDLIAHVLARNPTLAQMQAAFEAASARYPQVVSLDDPMAAGIVGPASIRSGEVDFAYRLEASQRFPFPGKRRLRGQNALAEASAAGNDVEDVRLQLVESARAAFYDYYLVTRALEVNEEALRLLGEFRGNADTRFRTGLVPQQDLLQADVEIGRQRERQLTLERMRHVVIARLNTLMHLPTGTPLPPPPRTLPPAALLPEVGELQARAVAQRPDLRALADRLAAEQASLALAYKEYYPDVEVMAAYDAFWQPRERDLRPMLGVRLNVPLRRARREGAVAEAHARVVQRQAELARQTDQVNLQVEEAYQQVRESERAMQLYEGTILPAARENVKAAQAAYLTACIPFLSLIEAERNLVGLRERAYETTADYFRRRAALDRAAGEPVTPPAAPATPSPGCTGTAPAGR
jgi:outer membrane protein TolC